MRHFLTVFFACLLLFFICLKKPFQKKSNPGNESTGLSPHPSFYRGDKTFPLKIERKTRPQETLSDTILSHWNRSDYDNAEQALADWLVVDDEAAIAFVGDLQAPYEASHFSFVIYEHLKKLSLHEAWELAKLLQTQTQVRLEVIGDIFSDSVQTNPSIAIELLKSADNDTDEFSYLLAHRVAIAGHFGEPRLALKELEFLSNSNVKLALITGLLERWLVDDPKTATEFLNQAEDSHLYDRATMNYAKSAASISPVDAMSWALAIVQKDLRESAIQSVSNVWQEQDPEEFSLWREE